MQAAESRKKESRLTILTRELRFGKPLVISLFRLAISFLVISFKIPCAGFFNFFEITTVN